MPDPIVSWSTLALAILSFVAVGISYWGIKNQANSLARSVSADLCLKMVDRFDSRPMTLKRRLGAEALLKNSDLALADDVFDFFELLGLYLRKEMLDKEIVHSLFFHWINLYWSAGKDYIKKSRDRSDDLYSDFEYLYNEVLAIQIKSCPRSRDINLTMAEINALLEQELD